MSAEAAEQFAGSDLVLEQPNCRLFVGDRELGAGTLSITEWYDDLFREKCYAVLIS